LGSITPRQKNFARDVEKRQDEKQSQDSPCAGKEGWCFWRRQEFTQDSSLWRGEKGKDPDGQLIQRPTDEEGSDSMQDDKGNQPPPQPASGFAGLSIERGVEPQPPLDGGPAQVAFFAVDDDK